MFIVFIYCSKFVNPRYFFIDLFLPNTLELGVVKKVLIFDFDGVLADSLDLMLLYAKQVCDEMGYPCVPTQHDLEALEIMEFSKYGMQLGIPPEKIDEFVSRNLKLFNSNEEPLPIFPGMDKVIIQLSGSAIVAMITGNSRIVVSKFIRAHGLNDDFQKVLTTEDAGNRVEKILDLKAQYKNPNNNFFFIGDAVSDIRAARNAGIKSVAVGWGHQSLMKLTKEEPDFIADKPTELLTLFV
jgi:phosphoglycolate phosphatase-like HAD superfamily hydrolase